MHVRQVLIGAVASCALAGAAAAQVGGLDVNGPYTQVASGMTFPTEVGAFERIGVTRYALDGSDESAGYQLREPYVTVTTYVYPSPPLPAEASTEQQAAACAQQFQTVQAEISTASSSSALLEQGEAVLPRGESAANGHRAIYRVMPPSAFGQAHEPLRSEVHLFCYVGGRWSVKYRATYAEDDEAGELVAAFMRDLSWTIGAGGAL